MGPRANFACLAKRCQQDGAATIYELPITATRCPVCGSKRIRRLYDSINISSGVARKTDALVGPTIEQALDRDAEVRASAAQNQKLAGAVRAVPIGQVGARLSELGIPAMSISADAGKATALSRPPSSAFVPFAQQQPKPTILARDREWGITKTADGTLAPVKQ